MGFPLLLIVCFTLKCFIDQEDLFKEPSTLNAVIKLSNSWLENAIRYTETLLKFIPFRLYCFHDKQNLKFKVKRRNEGVRNFQNQR